MSTVQQSEYIETNDVDSVKVEADQKCLKITVKVSRPSNGIPVNARCGHVVEQAIYLFEQAKKQLEQKGYTVAPLPQK